MIDVVAGVFCTAEKVLIARRKEGKSLAGYWEFPGGKVEAGESNPQALKRELYEEFSLDVRVGPKIGENTHNYGEKTIRLIAFHIEEFKGEMNAVDHDQVQWVALASLENYRLAPADIPLIRMIRSYLVL